MIIESTPISCGVDFLSELYASTIHSELARNVHALQEQAFMIFSDAVENGNGKALASYITKNKLGTITATRGRRNPNSNNIIKVWVWSINRKALNKHFGYKPSSYQDDYY